ncbi:uncharacterized protein CTHT_0032270 [Thermochaetoides thermophila DSM 1495]|uniref:Uncharacterized protein n=1 Tax=Chaetomium thermophilum (strain DSM 1495 / CBS 144.50 / IMI 039719) TaxID=759272 RepID=G0S553_CHATD|nr:hypothetical protein CTHT_0032270 [Thermochaetoides thermophila DSM 1495]EGS21372.1 hypothetical protein CTHT_0032270 [Thermochaetoides thermophila DSM 1495]
MSWAGIEIQQLRPVETVGAGERDGQDQDDREASGTGSVYSAEEEIAEDADGVGVNAVGDMSGDQHQNAGHGYDNQGRMNVGDHQSTMAGGNENSGGVQTDHQGRGNGGSSQQQQQQQHQQQAQVQELDFPRPVKRRRIGEPPEDLPQIEATPERIFKPNLPEPDDHEVTECWFEHCNARSGNTRGHNYMQKHFTDKHALIRADQGRTEIGGRFKSPKYLALCPTDWPFNYVLGPSCKWCTTIQGIRAIIGDPTHEGPAICTFCWTFLPTRADLIRHVDHGPCKSNEMYERKLAMIRDLYLAAIRMPDAPAIARAAEGARAERAAAERVARSEEWQIERAMQQRAMEHMRLWKQRQLQQQQQQQQQQQEQLGQDDVATTAEQAAPTPPAPIHTSYQASQQAPASAFSTQRFISTEDAGSEGTPGPSSYAAPAVPAPTRQSALAGTAVSYAQPAAAPALAGPGVAAGGDGTGNGWATAAIDAMARSIDRLSSVVAELTATNTQLTRELKERDERIAALEGMLAQAGAGLGGGVGRGRRG